MAGIPALPKSHFGKKWSYEVLTAQRRYLSMNCLKMGPNSFRWGYEKQMLGSDPEHFPCYVVSRQQTNDTLSYISYKTGSDISCKSIICR